MHYLLIYDVVDDYVERRQPYREEHLRLAQEFVDRGELELGGALDRPVDQAVLLFRANDPKPIHEFVLKDPYIRFGLVKSWRIRPWMTVVGKNAQVPIPPPTAGS